MVAQQTKSKTKCEWCNYRKFTIKGVSRDQNSRNDAQNQFRTTLTIYIVALLVLQLT